ncbi:sulfite exporter TauE/SafE family protein [Marinoscillum furvescens]|uniref:Probable membrane transporter protein n=1 Tax=Marinoscillum furvescens DSM 4134 TaxID=1122208 RepID=A0A3D9LIY1_MARFU|nr:sulfite exporter TauE/SafE family protein [Marinoscillum furvescens]REE05616.1 hypothetical protein C7460_101133 [Marinoscillum furvescens DSM 4134]
MEYSLLIILFVVSVLYASVGHGGASGYLAVLALYGFSPAWMKPTALLLNLFVAGIAFWQFYRNGYFKRDLFLLFAVTSIPAAFVGGMIDLDPVLYKKVLGVLLVFAVLRLSGIFGEPVDGQKDIHGPLALIIGLVIGFFSGMIGIGGGIILSPVIMLLGWAKAKQTAAISALFIWINSLSGLAGSAVTGISVGWEVMPYIAVTLIGGLLGGYMGSFKTSDRTLKYVLSAVLALASLKLIIW